MINGRCICGEVAVELHGPIGGLSACHCDNCRRFSGSVQMGFEVKPDDVQISGPVKVHRSSRIAERAWCDTCGSPIWFRYVADRDTGYFELVPGLFDNAAGAILVRENYSDKCPQGYQFAGQHQRITAAQYEAANPNVSGENP